VKIIFAEGDDWRGVYLDGELYLQGHSFSMWEIANVINKAGGNAEAVDVDLDWLMDEGRLPLSYYQVVLDA